MKENKARRVADTGMGPLFPTMPFRSEDWRTDIKGVRPGMRYLGREVLRQKKKASKDRANGGR